MNNLLGKNLKISPLAHIEDGVEIGDNTEIREFVVIRKNVKIGANNIIYPNVVIGEEPQDRSFVHEKSFVEIGDANIIRENVTIHKAVGLEQATVVGNSNFLMAGVHLAHNARVGNFNTLANNVSLAGYCQMGNYVTCGGAAQFHQHTKIGDYAMVSGLAGVNKDVLPYMIFAGVPAAAVTTNRVALKKYNFTQEQRVNAQKAFKIIYDSSYSVATIIEKLELLAQDSIIIENILNFIKNSKRGIITDKYCKS